MAETNTGGKTFIETLFHHNTWANLRLLTACEGLDDALLDAQIPGTYGTVRDTLLHIVGAEVSYVRRVNGRLPGEPPKEGEFPSFEQLKHDTAWCGDELLQLALNAGLTDIVEQTRQGKRIQYKLVSLMTQVINHATEHRAQVATILTQQGVEPPDMSGWAYMEDMGEFEETEE